ncbi:MAG: hydrogenase formation protein HypD [candidate division WOR-3 bacterium]
MQDKMTSPLSDFRKKERVDEALSRIDSLVQKLPGPVKLMHVCGSHEHTLVRWGLRPLLPGSLELVSGPGCPVCVASSQEVREAIEISKQGAILCTFGDMIRDVTPYGSLAETKAHGADVRIVYSGLDALRLARENPHKEVVFFAIGFETTAAPTAALVLSDPPDNFSILTSHRLTPPAVEALIRDGVPLRGIIAPGHVSSITGAIAWNMFPEDYDIPAVVAGFEPLDVLLGTIILLEDMIRGEAHLHNEYSRVVKHEGNTRAQEMMSEAFEVREAFWRGLGMVPDSGLFLREKFSHLDARCRFGIEYHDHSEDMPEGCSCGLVVTGRAYPTDCPLFMSSCRPENPYGPCMVSVEGTCYIWAKGRIGF